MVTRLLLVALCATTLAACSNNDAPADEAGAPLTADDVRTASPLTGNEARLDTLTLKLKVGETYRYRITQTSNGGPDSAFLEQRSTHVYTKRVKGVRGDGTYEIGMTFDTITIDVKASNRITGAVLQEQHYTSKDSAHRKDPQFSQFNALLGEEVTVLLRPNATIQEISGVTSIVNKIAAGRPMPDDVRQQYTRQIEMAAYAPFVEQEHLRFPTNRIDSTQAWSVSTTAPLLNNVFIASSTSNYRIASVRNVKGHRVAEVVAEMNGTVAAGKLPPQAGMSVTMGASAIDGKGRTLVDADKGYTISKTNELTTDLAATVKNTANGNTQRMAQRTQMRTTVELLR